MKSDLDKLMADIRTKIEAEIKAQLDEVREDLDEAEDERDNMKSALCEIKELAEDQL